MNYFQKIRKGGVANSFKKNAVGANRGFTLIELLVVISIISLLSSVVLASVNNAKKKGVDAAIVQDAKQLSNALELYYLTNKSYPVEGYSSEWSDGFATVVTDYGNFANIMKPYISKVPTVRYSSYPFAIFAYINNDQTVNDGYVMNCGSTISSGPGLPKYIVYFTTNLSLNLPYVYYHEFTGDQTYMNGSNGTMRWYCVTSR